MSRRSTVTSRRLGRRLAELRGDRDAREVIAHMGWDRSMLSKIEHGERRVQPKDLRKLLDHYGADDHDRAGLIALNGETAAPNWLHEYTKDLPEDFGAFLDCERHASVISEYSQIHIPGLLQTPEFARVQMRSSQLTDSDEEIESRLEARMARQAILDREHPPRVRWVLEESAIRRLVGGPDVMRDQLAHVLDIADRLTNSLVVVRYAAGTHAAATSSFVMFDFDQEDPTVVYHELLTSSVYIDRQQATARYQAAFESALTAALSPAETKRLIETVMKEWT